MLKLLAYILVSLLAPILVKCTGCYDFSIAGSSWGGFITPNTIRLDTNVPADGSCLVGNPDCVASMLNYGFQIRTITNQQNPSCTFNDPSIVGWSNNLPVSPQLTQVRILYAITGGDHDTCFGLLNAVFWGTTGGRGNGNSCRWPT
jgi:hypothetical protein